MMDSAFALFETAIGPCAIAWGEGGILGVQLPEADETRTRSRMRRRFPDAREGSPPTDVEHIIARIVALLGGEPVDFSAVTLDMERVPEFNRRVYEIARTIRSGATITYGEIAKRLGVPAEAREVGEAMGRNPFPIIVPCHRVLAANGKLGGFSAPGGVRTKRRLLAIEGARSTEGPDLFDRGARAE
jgi:methylated-DNA-[protein]-cysteine S-methyltransferase